MTNSIPMPEIDQLEEDRVSSIINHKTDAELAILATETTDPKVLNALAEHPNHIVVRAVIHNPKITEETLRILEENQNINPTLLAQFLRKAEEIVLNTSRENLLHLFNKRITEV
jgi:hypothetical protein